MKNVTKSNLGLGVHLLHYNMWNEDLELRLLLSICISLEMKSENLWIWIIKNSKIWRQWYVEQSDSKKIQINYRVYIVHSTGSLLCSDVILQHLMT